VLTAASLPLLLQIAVVTISAAAALGTAGGAYLLIRSKQVSTNAELADSAVQSLTSANAALESRLTLVERENQHCAELKDQQDKVIAAQASRIDDLEKWVTARDLVEKLTSKVDGAVDMNHRAFAHLGVPAEVLAKRRGA
jgi:hypothetical protein